MAVIKVSGWPWSFENTTDMTLLAYTTLKKSRAFDGFHS